MELDTNNHSVFLLYYHLVLVTKYRRQVIDDEISDYAKVTFERISKLYHITLVEWNHDKDHIHIIFKAQPKTELTKVINTYKSANSRLIKHEFPRVKQFLRRATIKYDYQPLTIMKKTLKFDCCKINFNPLFIVSVFLFCKYNQIKKSILLIKL